jgi:Zn finger protein HypA/HybF involved in hydrogenase expression
MALESHMNSPRHTDDYTSPEFLDGHDDSDADSDSVDDDPYCNGCERQFIDMAALNQHLFASPKHNWCFDCSRDFTSETALSNHQNSLAHRGRDFKCPFCQGMFKSPSGIALHIESGCHKFTRHHVTAAVQAMDIVPNIAIKRITGPMCPPTVRTYIATEASFNGSAYQCYLCAKLFRTLSALNGHLNSPAHDDDEFRCPKCKAEFKLISGFTQHLESRSCGLAETTQIDNYFNDLTTQFSRLLKF